MSNKEKDVSSKRLQALDLDTLDQVSGGYLTESKELFLDEQLYTWQKQFGSKENVLVYLKNDYDKTDLSSQGISLEDAEFFVTNNA